MLYTEIKELLLNSDRTTVEAGLSLTKKFNGLQEYIEARKDFEHDVLEAAYELGIEFNEVSGKYEGKYDSDVEFAENFAESIGALDSNQDWPYTCINWEAAARELMTDYIESNGHYFFNY